MVTLWSHREPYEAYGSCREPSGAKWSQKKSKGPKGATCRHMKPLGGIVRLRVAKGVTGRHRGAIERKASEALGDIE